MTIDEAEELVLRCQKVILSCKSLPQLNNAVNYARLAYKKVAFGVGLINNAKFISLIERTIGFAQCQIKFNTETTEGE